MDGQYVSKNNAFLKYGRLKLHKLITEEQIKLHKLIIEEQKADIKFQK